MSPITETDLNLTVLSGTDQFPPRITRTLASGQNVVEGEVLGVITADDKVRQYLTGSVDGSEVARLIAAEAVNALAGDLPIECYFLGLFIEDNMTGLDTAGKLELRDRGIWTKALT